MTLADYQWSFNDRVLGPGTNYKVPRWTHNRGVTSADGERGDGPGQYLGPEWPDAADWVLEVTVLGSSPADTLANYELLASAWTLRGTEGGAGTLPLIFKRPGQVQRRTANGRPRAITVDKSTAKLRYIQCQLVLACEESFEFSDTEHSYDLVYNGSNVHLDNDGNYPASVTYDVYGLVTNPGVIRSEAERFDLTTAIGNLDYYRVRTDAKTIIRASDAASLYETWDAGSVWLEIPPGGALFRTVGTGGSGSVKTRMFWRDTWWL